MRHLITISLLAVVFISWTHGAAQPSSPVSRPNIILFCSDDHGWRDSGCYGDKVVRTPNVDRLAREGMRFTQAFSASPLCTPSRCVIETGLMPFRNGADLFNANMKPGTLTIPVYFKKLGYYTAEIGKFHHAPKTPEAFPYDHINTKEQTAVQFIKDYNLKQPLLLLVNSNQPHTPWAKNKTYNPKKIVLPPNFIDTPQTRLDRAEYYTDIGLADDMLGQVLRAVDAKGWRNNTLFMYTTDQGANWPFAKWCVYDAGLRVPFIVRWPGKTAAKSVSDACISLADLLPTWIAAAGGTPPDTLDGRSFLPVLTGKTDKHRDVAFGTHTGQLSRNGLYPARTVIIPERYQYILNLSPELTFSCVIMGSRQALGKKFAQHYQPFWSSWVEAAKTDKFASQIVNAYLHRPREELYDLAADPYEMKNLATDPKLADVRRDLRRQLAEWCQQQGDTQPLQYLKP